MLACISGEGGILGRVASTDQVIAAWTATANPVVTGAPGG
jgi:hypothetical protein